MHLASLISQDNSRSGLFLVLALTAAGCGGASVSAPKYDPEAMAHAAMNEYDTNGDGKLDATELEACPALKDALANIAKDKQSHLTEEDLTERLRQFVDSKLGGVVPRCKVIRGNQGVANVTVTLVPERFMGETIQPASGTSGPDGTVHLKIEGADFPGARLGYYRIEASQKDPSGKELLPARYNSSSKLGCEVHHKKMESILIELD
jgi:hypothetical protein